MTYAFKEEYKKNLNSLKILTLKDQKFLFIDTEYLKDGFSVYKNRLVTIQYASFSLDNIIKRKIPKLTILCLWNYSSEKALLQDFYPHWNSLFTSLRHQNRHLPIGYSLDVDIETLRSKYKKQKLEQRSFFQLWHESRAIDLKQFGTQITGLVDPRLGTVNTFLKTEIRNFDSNDIMGIVKTILNPQNVSNLTHQKEQLLQYIRTEFEETFLLICKLFGNNYSFKNDSLEFRAIKHQEERMNQKRRMNRIEVI